MSPMRLSTPPPRLLLILTALPLAAAAAPQRSGFRGQGSARTWNPSKSTTATPNAQRPTPNAGAPGSGHQPSTIHHQPAYDRDVRPILAARCYACHGPNTQRNGLRLDLKERILQGG